MAVPASVITLIAGMSTGLITLGIGIIALVALLAVAGAFGQIGVAEDGKTPVYGSWLSKHSTALAAVIILITAAMFVGLGGLPLIGIASIPVFGTGTWLLIVVAVAVLWMLSGN